MKWRLVPESCDKKIPPNLKGKFSRVMIKPTLYMELSFSQSTTHMFRKMQAAEMRMLRWMCSYTKRYNIKNDNI
uniref:Putative ovule protein n=1 Tax=Solanum chacoense TaxID=4108 RepID=A0A0V0HFP0_SOLCH